MTYINTKNCPFCGSSDLGYYYPHPFAVQVRCERCGAGGSLVNIMGSGERSDDNAKQKAEKFWEDREGGE